MHVQDLSVQMHLLRHIEEARKLTPSANASSVLRVSINNRLSQQLRESLVSGGLAFQASSHRDAVLQPVGIACRWLALPYFTSPDQLSIPWRAALCKLLFVFPTLARFHILPVPAQALRDPRS